MEESLNIPIESDLENLKKIQNQISDSSSVLNDQSYLKKYIKLKKYLRNNEKKFIQLEQTNLRALKHIFSILSPQQKLGLIRKYI